MQNFIFSIKLKYCEQIFNGDKTVEFRRTQVRIASGDRIIIYASSPIKAIVGSAIVEKSAWLSTTSLWKATNQICGLSQQDFLNYFGDRTHGCGIWLQNPCKILNPIWLEALRCGTIETARLHPAIPSWMPPQNFRRLKDEEKHILPFL
ncbi:MAG: hypothetical protein F6J93_03720 [Oscillatoria sp. SIO1A7]|nr:hypothetical protein [Oscillatoria sp. SIO1A7]